MSRKGAFFRNAYVLDASEGVSYIEEELKNYPDNYAIYKEKWNYLFFLDMDSSKLVIEQDLKFIETVIGGESIGMESVKLSKESMLFALCTGSALLGNFEKSRFAFAKLMENSPSSPLLSQAQEYFDYQLFSHSKEDPLMEKLVFDFIRKNPESEISKNSIYLLRKSTSSKDREALGKIASYWMQKEPDNAMMYYYYAKSLDDERDKLLYLGKCVNTLLDNNLRVKNRYSWDRSIPNSLVGVIEEYEKIGAFAQALSLMALMEQNSKEKNESLLFLKGRVLQGLNQYKGAFESYVLAGGLGSAMAEDSARAVYPQLGLHDPDFEVRKNEILRESFYAESVSAALPFEVEDIDGNALKLTDLKGKVVVLNFWFIACAPCRVEMPGLNEMVNEFNGKDVIFIAFALDSKEKLTKFLAKNDFNYKIVPSAGEISRLYDVGVYPTHIIIDKEGNVRTNASGGSKDRHQMLIPKIERVLKF